MNVFVNIYLDSCRVVYLVMLEKEKFYFWTGSGGNGKSKLVDLVEFALGEYSKSMDVSYLTTKSVVHHLLHLN